MLSGFSQRNLFQTCRAATGSLRAARHALFRSFAPITFAALYLCLLSNLTACTRAAGIPIFIPAPNPIPIEVIAQPEPRSHPLVHPLIADSSASAGEDSGALSAELAGDSARIPPDDILTVDVHSGDINTLVTAHSGNRVYSGGNDGLVVQTSLIGDSRTTDAGDFGAIETSILLRGSKPIQALAIDPKGKVLAVSQYGSVVVYDFETREIVARLTRLDGRVTALSWDSRGELLALGRADGGLFVWNVFRGPRAGEDTLDAVERYNGATSPIERINFHPAARIFFALEKKGIVGVWRLARTEFEMGLRDTDRDLNQPQPGIRRWTFIQLPAPIEDFGSTGDGKYLHLILADGKVIQWKIRGLKAVGIVGAGEVNSYQLAEISLRNPANQPLKLLATTGRTETLSIWCQNLASAKGPSRINTDNGDQPVPGESDGENDLGGMDAVSNSPNLAEVVNEFTDVSAGVQAAEPLAADITAYSPIMRSTPLRQPLKAIDAPAVGSTLLWASQKTGNLLVFKLNSLFSAAAGQRYRQQCKD